MYSIQSFHLVLFNKNLMTKWIGAVVVVIRWQRDLRLPMQLHVLPITIKFESLNPAYGEMHSPKQVS